MQNMAAILVIEDNPADSHLISKAFEERCPGMKYFIADNGVTGSDYVFQRGVFASTPLPNLILLDLNLPGKDGRELLQEIKSDKRLRSIPIIMFTSSEAESDIKSCFDQGANAYFSKPADLEEFMGIMELICQHWIKKGKLPNRR